jgi:predicted amidohydrolase YtcJ
LENLYPITRFMKHRVRVAAGSDCPIVKPNPLIGIFAAVTRMSERGKPVLAEEGIEPFEALRMFTETAADASFEEQMRGSITIGKAADFVVLNDDPTRVNADEIKTIKVEMTIIDGKIVWERKT